MTVSIFNNSGADLAIRLADGEEPWPRGSVWNLGKRADRIRWVQDEATGGTVPVLDVVKGAEIRSYLLRAFPLPVEFLSEPSATRAHLQMESDGFLYAVKPGQQPASIPDPQPSRFPLKPS